MPVEPIHFSALGLDLSPRVASTTTVVASPAAAAETIIASVTIANFAQLQVVSGIALFGFAAFTVGTSGTACNLRIRQTNVAGTIQAATGATTGGITAANLVDINASGFDASAGVATYVLTLTVTGGAAVSTVSGVQLLALVI